SWVATPAHCSGAWTAAPSPTACTWKSSTPAASARTSGCCSVRWRRPLDPAGRRQRKQRALMFTGLVQGVGSLSARELRGGDARLRIAFGTLPATDIEMGESIAINGTCLTVVAFDAAGFEADASRETLALTTLGQLPVGRPLNLERALRAGDRLGGHLVSGHVDGVGVVTSLVDDARAQRWRFTAPRPLLRYIATKGSICVDGTSLTINADRKRVE